MILTVIGILAIGSVFTSVVVIAALILSSRLSQREAQFEEYDLHHEEERLDLPVQEGQINRS